jgi:hypothetical protein
MTIQEQEKTEKTEDSGLIEIRKMASRDIGAQEAALRRAEEEAVAAVSATEIPLSVSQPMMAVQVPAAQRRPGWVVPVAALGGLVVVAGVVFAILSGTQRTIIRAAGPEGAPPPVPVAMQAPSETGGAPAAPGVAPASQAHPAGAVALAAPQEAGGAKAAPAAALDPAERKARAEKGKADDHERGEPKPVAAKEPKAAKEPAKPGAKDEPKLEAPKPAGKKGDDLDALLNTGAAAKREDKPAADAEDSLPDTLSQDQIKTGMSAVKGKVQGCYDKYQVAGTAKVALSIGKNGKVASARSVGEFAGTPTGDCVVAAVKSATFPRFKRPSLAITYPFLLR